MKYVIEFDLPDNDTVLNNIKTALVGWNVWGYSGSAHAKPKQPERKRGIWKNRSLNILYPEWERYECSVCGGYSYIHKYCPNCGAKMEEGEQE